MSILRYSVKPVYKDHPGTGNVVSVDRWSSYRGTYISVVETVYWIVQEWLLIQDRWTLCRGGL